MVLNMTDKFQKLESIKDLTNQNFGSSPIYFSDKQKRKEWEEMDPKLKKHAMDNIQNYIDHLHDRSIIEFLGNIMGDFHERLLKIENKND